MPRRVHLPSVCTTQEKDTANVEVLAHDRSEQKRLSKTKARCMHRVLALPVASPLASAGLLLAEPSTVEPGDQLPEILTTAYQRVAVLRPTPLSVCFRWPPMMLRTPCRGLLKSMTFECLEEIFARRNALNKRARCSARPEKWAVRNYQRAGAVSLTSRQSLRV